MKRARIPFALVLLGTGLLVASEASGLPQISVPADCSNDTWSATSSVNTPDARLLHTVVWTGREMIVWGGFNFSPPYRLNTGARYNLVTDSWVATSIVSAPVGRDFHTAVWTGSEMIVWGGEDSSRCSNTGGRYNPSTDSWVAITATNAPDCRARHTAVWTGTEMIIWGGYGCGGNCQLNSGGRYNTATDSWTAITTTNAPSARAGHTAVWTGSEMIVWGGTDGTTNYPHSGGRYSPGTDSWMPTNLANVPTSRYSHTAVWTGSEMIIWGGVDESFNDTNTGGRYDPGTDSWIATNADSAPSPRDSHSAVWTGREMIVWGGYSPTADFNTGGRYDPGTDSWTAPTTANAPFARGNHTAVWTGNEMLVWGGLSGDIGVLDNGGRYCAQPSTPIVQSAVSRKMHGSAVSFDINLPLSGTPGIECRRGGSTGDYTIVVTFLANVSVNGSPQAAVTSGIGTIGSSGVADGGTVTIADNIVTIPLTNVTNA